LREFEWIGKAAELFGREHDGAPVGIGDDCALLTGPGPVLASIDTVVAGVHFEPCLMTAPDIGWRALAVALSDLAACGADPARPIHVLLSLQLPDDFPDTELLGLAAGLRDCAREHGGRIVGGDTVGTPGPLAITVTVLGSADRPVWRRGARPGDLLVVTGELGAAGLGLAALRAGWDDDDARRCALAYRRPRARLAAGFALARVATALIDISDGLLQDLGHVGAASGVGANVDLDRLPVAAAAREVARRLGADPLEYAAGFGDEYQLLAAVPPSRLAELAGELPDLTPIGEFVAGSAGVARQNGRPVEPRRRGYEHGRKK